MQSSSSWGSSVVDTVCTSERARVARSSRHSVGAALPGRERGRIQHAPHDRHILQAQAICLKRPTKRVLVVLCVHIKHKQLIGIARVFTCWICAAVGEQAGAFAMQAEIFSAGRPDAFSPAASVIASNLCQKRA